ncbi:hypothetical protein R3P38DRAFT_3192881 [Favolaschia claudopus]|uniref:Uncharacterized protein n=1 Tax=Favolaschia claudopus TaxID=2862362 RepID=A0AAW0BK26_9AGAR
MTRKARIDDTPTTSSTIRSSAYPTARSRPSNTKYASTGEDGAADPPFRRHAEGRDAHGSVHNDVVIERVEVSPFSALAIAPRIFCLFPAPFPRVHKPSHHLFALVSGLLHVIFLFFFFLVLFTPSRMSEMEDEGRWGGVAPLHKPQGCTWKLSGTLFSLPATLLGVVIVAHTRALVCIPSTGG